MNVHSHPEGPLGPGRLFVYETVLVHGRHAPPRGGVGIVMIEIAEITLRFRHGIRSTAVRGAKHAATVEVQTPWVKLKGVRWHVWDRGWRASACEWSHFLAHLNTSTLSASVRSAQSQRPVPRQP
jgi:hypothetical protein